MKARWAGRAWELLLERAYPLVDGTSKEEGRPFDPSYAMVPHLDSRRVGTTHYGIMIPDLPPPHRFYSIMSILGAPGVLAMDTDHVLIDTPRRSATVVSGTAATYPRHFGGYSVRRDCEASSDGSLVRFGDDVEIRGQYPEFHAATRCPGFELAIDIHATDKVSWFVKTPVYDHLSLLAQYSGHVRSAGEELPISGLCTFEYAACVTPHVLRDRPLPDAWKVPLDFFTYQVVNLDDGEQLLLVSTRVKGVRALSKAYLRGLNRYGTTSDADFDVRTYQREEAVAPDGKSMRLPRTFAWIIREGNRIVGEIEGEVDTPFLYGLGSGYVGGYAQSGLLHGRKIEGRGYIEYIDRRR